MPKITLITGGVRSGKSARALELARSRCEGKKAFLATAQTFDEEMKRRVKAHRKERGGEFETLEETLELGQCLELHAGRFELVVLDCLGMWVNNLLYLYGPHSPEVEQKLNDFVKVLTDCPTELIIVTNEAGMGIVPENPIARAFAEILGRLNQQVQQLSQEVILMVSGQPLYLKREGIAV